MKQDWTPIITQIINRIFTSSNNNNNNNNIIIVMIIMITIITISNKYQNSNIIYERMYNNS